MQLLRYPREANRAIANFYKNIYSLFKINIKAEPCSTVYKPFPMSESVY